MIVTEAATIIQLWVLCYSQFPDQEHESNLDEVASAAIYHRRRSVFDAEVTDEKKEQKAKQMQVPIVQALQSCPWCTSTLFIIHDREPWL